MLSLFLLFLSSLLPFSFIFLLYFIVSHLPSSISTKKNYVKDKHRVADLNLADLDLADLGFAHVGILRLDRKRIVHSLHWQY